MSATIKIGDTVLWRGGWGAQPAKSVRVASMELCEELRQKYGIPVDAIHARDKDRTLFVLDNGHWAYGYQIETAGEVNNERIATN
jgi:hypothetical protein